MIPDVRDARRVSRQRCSRVAQPSSGRDWRARRERWKAAADLKGVRRCAGAPLRQIGSCGHVRSICSNNDPCSERSLRIRSKPSASLVFPLHVNSRKHSGLRTEQLDGIIWERQRYLQSRSGNTAIVAPRGFGVRRGQGIVRRATGFVRTTDRESHRPGIRYGIFSTRIRIRALLASLFGATKPLAKSEPSSRGAAVSLFTATVRKTHSRIRARCSVSTASSHGKFLARRHRPWRRA